MILKDSSGATVDTQDDVRCPQYTAPETAITKTIGTAILSVDPKISEREIGSAAYTRNATIVEDRTLLASASATTLNNNNVLAALIADLQDRGVIN
jgi:hypothetical protein